MKTHALLLVLAVVVPIAGGCFGSTPPSRFYVLSSEGRPLPGDAGPKGEAQAVFLSRVELPEYLRQNEIVVRADGHQLVVAEQERWGEPLDKGVPRVLSRNLAALLPDHALSAYPWERPPAPYSDVAVALTRFDAEGGQVYLEARWRIETDAGTLQRRTAIARAVEGEGYPSIVAAMSAALAALAQDIADAVQNG